MGAIVVKLPLPPGCLPTLWQADARFRESYLMEFPGYYKTADAGFTDADGYIYVMSRTDDIINVAGHRLSTGGMEEVLSGHKDVAECPVIGIADPLKGEVPCGFIVLKAGVNRLPAEIEAECIALVREKIGPVAAFKLAIAVARLPKTRSGKILRGTMKKIADGEAWTMPATIDDPAILDEIGGALQAKGLAVLKKLARAYIRSEERGFCRIICYVRELLQARPPPEKKPPYPEPTAHLHPPAEQAPERPPMSTI